MTETSESPKGPGYVYLIKHHNSNGLHKIGRTIKPDNRMNQLGGEDLDVIALVLCTDANEVERELHRQYSSKRLPQSEWFNLSTDEVRQVQSKLEEVFTDGRRSIKLHGKHLPSLSQVRDKERQVEALEMQLKNLKELEVQCKSKEVKYQESKKEVATQLNHISELKRTIKELSNRDYAEEEFDEIIYDDLKYKVAAQNKQIKLLEEDNERLRNMIRDLKHTNHVQEIKCEQVRNQKNEPNKEQRLDPGRGSMPGEDLWGESAEVINQRMPSNNTSVDESKDNLKAKRLRTVEYCDENLFHRIHNPERDRAFLKAWNLRWFNKRYRPRMNDY